MHGADSVELKLTVPDTDLRSAVDSLGIDPLEAQIRQVVFFDTPDLALNTSGVVVRARRVQGGKGDTVVKLRPVTVDQLPELRRFEAIGVEVDAMPGGFVASASLKGKSSASDVRKVMLDGSGVSDLFSKTQRAFYTDHAPDGITLDDLAVLGPITLLKLKFPVEGIGPELVAELWFYPDGSRILELSTKATPNDALNTAAEARARLTALGIDLGGEQQTKTRTALDYFAGLLNSPGAAV